MKERIKSFVLIVLILGSICLSSITWMDKRLWPEGYSLFTNVKNWPIVRNFFEDDYSSPLENLGRARKIVVADGNGASAVYYNSDKTFDTVYGDIKKLLVAFLSGDAAPRRGQTLTREDVRDMLNAQIMYAYVNYPAATAPRLYGRLMGVPDTEALSSLSAVRDFFILPTGENSVELLAIDSETDRIESFELWYDKTNELIGAFTDYVADVDPAHNCMLALEMNMDTASPDDVVKVTALLDSFLVLDSASTADMSKAILVSENPLTDIREDRLRDMMACFDYRPESIRRYVDTEGVTVYLENDSSLKIYPDGILEFEALNPSHGVKLTGGTSLYESLNSAIRFAGKVYSSVTDAPFEMNVSGQVLAEAENEQRFDFDYYCAGTPVTTDVEGGEFSMHHAVEMTVVDNRVTAFRMLLREYEKTDENTETTTIYGAIDAIAAANTEQTEPVTVNDLFVSYREDGKTPRLSACWTGYVNGERVIIGQ